VDGVTELYDATLMEVHEDFASDVIDRVMPRDRDWLKYEPEETLDEAIAKQLKPEFEKRTSAIFSAIRQSNLYEEAASEWAGNLGHGTSALAIIDYGAGQPICFEAITPAQLLILRGPGGVVNFRAREYRWAIEDIIAYWPNYKWPEKLKRKASQKSTKRQLVRVIEAASMVPDPGGQQWNWRVAVDDMLVYEENLSGRGSCPLVVTRWRSVSSSAWGLGPGLKTLPDAMTLNQERRMVLKTLGKWADPPVIFDDDGLLNPEGGIGPGDWIPRAVGSKIEQLEPKGAIQAVYYEQGQLQDNIRRGLYQYGPRQRGKTPPTFGQWMDEKNEEGRRLELPTGKVYAEGVIAILDRVEYLLTKRGELDEGITSTKGLVRLRPLSPLARQQAQEDVQQSSQVLGLLRSTLDPQTLAATVDLQATATNIVEALNDKIIVIRDPDKASALLQQVIGSSSDAGPPEAAQPAPAAEDQ
jgi:hypothetical protein